MIISHKYKFIFFAVPRTATHSIRQALSPWLALGDWQQQSLHERHGIPIAEIARIGHGHVSLSQIKQHVSSDIWSSYFKFAFVRNPYERYVSVCTFLNKNNANYASQATEFMRNAFQFERFRQRVLVRPQIEMLLDEEGNLGMDFIGRYEMLQDSWVQICDRIGIKPQTLQQQNHSSHRHYKEYYDPILIDLVRDFYRMDFAMLEYPQSIEGK